MVEFLLWKSKAMVWTKNLNFIVFTQRFFLMGI